MGQPFIRLFAALLVGFAFVPTLLSQTGDALVERLVKIAKEKKVIKPKSDDKPYLRLKIEQYNLALEELQIRCKDFQNKLIRLETVIEAARKVFRSELNITDKSSERIRIYEEAIGLVKWYEGELEKSLKNGSGNKADMLKMRFDRLGLEAELINEKDKSGDSKPDQKK